MITMYFVSFIITKTYKTIKRKMETLQSMKHYALNNPVFTDHRQWK